MAEKWSCAIDCIDHTSETKHEEHQQWPFEYSRVGTSANGIPGLPRAQPALHFSRKQEEQFDEGVSTTEEWFAFAEWMNKLGVQKKM